MKWLKPVNTDEVELEVIECDCGFHLGIDATYLDQVDEGVTITCPSCRVHIKALDLTPAPHQRAFSRHADKGTKALAAAEAKKAAEENRGKRPPQEGDIDPETGEPLAFPYCGGCGHRYFQSDLQPESKAKQTTPCRFCVEEANQR